MGKVRETDGGDLPKGPDAKEATSWKPNKETIASIQGRKNAARESKWQGDLGEGIALRVASEKLGLTPDPRFDQRYHGLDVVCDDDKENLVLIDSKCDERGIKALEGDQMQPEWVERTAAKMQNPKSAQYTPGNAEIGAEIQRAGADKVRRLVVTTHPTTLRVRCYEGQPDRTWKLIGEWSAFEFEQPQFP